MGKMGCWGLKKEEQNYISDVWEKWGGHIWGNGVLGILLKERIRFLTYGRNGVATYGEKGNWGLQKRTLRSREQPRRSGRSERRV